MTDIEKDVFKIALTKKSATRTNQEPIKNVLLHDLSDASDPELTEKLVYNQLKAVLNENGHVDLYYTDEPVLGVIAAINVIKCFKASVTLHCHKEDYFTQDVI